MHPTTKERIKAQLKLSEEEFDELFLKTSPYVTQRELDSLAKSLATKEDLFKVEKATKEDLFKVEKALKEDLFKVEKALKEDLFKVEKALKEDLFKVEKALKEDQSNLSDKIDRKFNWLIGTLFSFFIAIIVVLIAMLR
jgi:hypothetical protein